MTRGFERRADFIWRPRDLQAVTFSTAAPRLPEEANRFVYLRRSFELAAVPSSADVHATADGRYQLFVNGTPLLHGPARSSAAFRYLDPIDLVPYLRPGRNVIAVLAHSYGRNTAWYELPGWDYARAFGCGGFFLQGEVTAGDLTQVLDSDPQWRCHTATAWQREVPSNSLGYAEIFDARLAPQGWAEIGFDDSGWERAEPLRVAGRNYSGDVRPFQYLLPRDTPAQREGPLRPGRAVAFFELACGPEGPDLAAQMEAESPLPLALCRVSAERDRIETAAGHAVSVVYDFGEVVAGYIHLELDGPAGAVVDFYPGEQLLPDGRVRIYDGIPGFDAQIAHRYVLRQGAQSWQRFEWNGLRYLQVTYRRCGTPLQVRAVAVHQTEYPVQARGHFECSDPALNRIWQAGATTLRRCMHDAFVDCPSREQRQWMDAYLDIRINYAAFGDTALAARLIRQIADSQRPDGQTMMAAPGDFSLACFTNIPDFGLLWILTIGDYLLHADDAAIAEEIYPAVARALQWFERHLNQEDLLTDVPHWVFVEWAETDKKGQVAALNALYVAALRVAVAVAQLCEHPRAATRYEDLAGRVATALNALLWDDVRGVYVDARRGGQRSRRISQQTNAILIALGIAPRARWDSALDHVLDARRLVLTHALASDGKVTPFDEERQVVMAQPFYSHFLHRAMRAAGRTQAVVDNIRSRWGAMLDSGHGTFTETWQVEPVTSLCHAWSATPTFDLSTDLLGVSAIAAGFSRARIAPQAAGLSWARGAFPTPCGDVAVDWRSTAERFELTVDLPAGCEADVVSPIAGGWREVNGVATSGAALTLGAGRHRMVAYGRPE